MNLVISLDEKREFLGLNDFCFIPIRAQYADVTCNGYGIYDPIVNKEKSIDADFIKESRTESIFKVQ